MATLRIVTPGLGAVSTTLIAGVELARLGLASPVGSLTEYADVGGSPIRDHVVPINEIAFAAWDPYAVDGFEAAQTAGVLRREHLHAAAPALVAVKPMRAVFDASWARRLEGARHIKQGTWMEQAEELTAEMREFQAAGERVVMVWCGSTEAYREPGPVHATIEDFERGLKAHDPSIAPSQVYAYAAISAGVPYANGAPNISAEVPALVEFAARCGVPIAGKDFKTGQTLMKTILAPGLRARMLGINGWFSTNILGNRDGLVLDEPDNFRSKEVTKLGVLRDLLDPEAHPELYGDIDHQIKINYYRPRGDQKEGWDNIDIFGWLGYDMQIKVDFLCRDSILAAPVVLDLARLLDLAARNARGGPQDWLGFYLKSPMPDATGHVEHNLFEQERILYAAIAELIS
ncbi:MAG: inositol-3-phosphate synthase [Acidimicrobiia bacterium]|nr:inositol-3-phosphate synthase [Acidimicrobiia bacterium]